MNTPAADLVLGTPGGLELDFVFEPMFTRVLAAIGVRPGNSAVRVNARTLDVMFGHWRVTTPLDNILDATVTGPFSAWKVLGPRLSLADRGLTFGTSTPLGLCVTFRTPVSGIEPFRLITHPSLTCTVAEPQLLGQVLRELRPGSVR